jgi:hypothetical protein
VMTTLFHIYNIVVPEVIAIIAFGIAWLTKGQAILADNNKDIAASAAD